MFRDILKNLEYINTLPILALIFFLLFFIGVLIYVFKLDKRFVKYMSEVPLQKDNYMSINSDGDNNGKS